MGTIIFAIDSSISHYNASFTLARQLKERGHRIVYISVAEENPVNDIQVNIRIVHKLGYEFRLLELGPSADNFGVDVLAELAPDLVLLDSLHSSYALLLGKYNVKIVIFQTMVCLTKSRGVPPPSSKIVPNNGFWSRMRSEASWVYVKLKYLRRTYELKKGSKMFGVDFKDIDHESDLSFGFKIFPEFLMYPRVFDFPWRNVRKNQHYIGPMVDLSRENNYDFEFDQFYESVLINISLPVVYCSLGTMNLHHSDKCVSFFQRLVRSIEERNDVFLILAIGNKIDKKKIAVTSPNVAVFQAVPQLKVLQRAAIMITHGGLNSITESILHGVPMIVYPLNDLWDQNGNSARVLFHGIGLRGNIVHDSQAKISSRIHTLLNDESIKGKIARMSAEYNQLNNSTMGADLIERLLKSSEHLVTA